MRFTSKVVALAAVAALPFAGALQAQRSIPVYPGARLEIDEGDDACCSFVTADPAAKVIAFLESRTGGKGMDAKTLAARYPAMASQIRAMTSQMPTGMEYQVVVLGPADGGGADLIEVISVQGMTRFSLTEEQLGREGNTYGYEFRRKAKVANAADRAYEAWAVEHPVIGDRQLNLPVYPGARVHSSELSKAAADCYDLMLMTLDDVEKVVSYFRGRASTLKYRHVTDEEPARHELTSTTWEMHPCVGDGCRGETFVNGTRGAINRSITISRSDNPADFQVPPYLDAETRTWLTSAPPPTLIHVRSEKLDAACVDIPKNAVWGAYKP